MRVKCISVRSTPTSYADPLLVKNFFYEVVDPQVFTLADETPYIRIRVCGEDIDRPRHLFGPLLT